MSETHIICYYSVLTAFTLGGLIGIVMARMLDSTTEEDESSG